MSKISLRYGAMCLTSLFILVSDQGVLVGQARKYGHEELVALKAEVARLKKAGKVKGKADLSAAEKTALVTKFNAAYQGYGTKFGQRRTGAELTRAENALAELGYTPKDILGMEYAVAAGAKEAEKKLARGFKELGELSEAVEEPEPAEVEGLAAFPFPKDGTEVDKVIAFVNAVDKGYKGLFQMFKGAKPDSIKLDKLIENSNVVDRWVDKLKTDKIVLFANQLAELEAYQKVGRHLKELLEARKQLRSGAVIGAISADVNRATAKPFELNGEIRSYVSTLKALNDFLKAKDFDAVAKSVVYKNLSKEDQRWFTGQIAKGGGLPPLSVMEKDIKTAIADYAKMTDPKKIGEWITMAENAAMIYEARKGYNKAIVGDLRAAITGAKAKLASGGGGKTPDEVTLEMLKSKGYNSLAQIEGEIQPLVKGPLAADLVAGAQLLLNFYKTLPVHKQPLAAQLKDRIDDAKAITEPQIVTKIEQHVVALGSLPKQSADYRAWLIQSKTLITSTRKIQKIGKALQQALANLRAANEKAEAELLSIESAPPPPPPSGGDIVQVAIDAFDKMDTKSAAARVEELVTQVASGKYSEGNEEQVKKIAQAILVAADTRKQNDKDTSPLKEQLQDLRDNLV